MIGLLVYASIPADGSFIGVAELARSIEMQPSSRVGGEAPVSLATGGFLAAALRTGYVEIHITGCMSRGRLC